MATPIYTTEMRIQNAQTFLASISRVSPAPDVLYMYMGRTTAWADDGNPPSATDNALEERTTRTELIALKRLFESDSSLMIPRYDWTSGTTYDIYSDTDVDLFTKEFYVLTSALNVYKCIGNNGAIASTTEPTGSSTSDITTADGYVWKFMYDITAPDAAAFLQTSDFMPVPTGSRKSALQLAVETAAVDAVGQPLGGHGLNAFQELGAFYLLMVNEFDGDEGGIISTAIDYRQIGFIVNPELSAGGIATGNVYDIADIDILTGRILYIENREPVNRAPAQSERYDTIMTF